MSSVSQPPDGRGTPESSQIVWMEERIETLESEVQARQLLEESFALQRKMDQEQIEHLQRLWDDAQTELDLVSAVLATTGARYLDPPDGGDVPLHEQVSRVVSEAKRLTDTLTLIRDVTYYKNIHYPMMDVEKMAHYINTKARQALGASNGD